MTTDTIRLPASLAACVHFARFAAERDIPPADLAQIIAAAHKSKAAYERDQTYAENHWAQFLTAIAERYGYTVDWPGLWPTLEKGGFTYYLPTGK